MSVIIAPITESLTEFLASKNYTQIVVLVDQNTKKHCYPSIKAVLPKHTLIQIKSGEGNKNLSTCQHIWETMTNVQLDRHALLINLGGGVIGDMGGFCASTYKRGIDFIQIPTTLLAQVDASVGGKLGVDFEGLKNHIGVFQIPNAVLIDPDFLKTLPENELRSGFAEVIKHCLIMDSMMWEVIRKQDWGQQNWTQLINHSVEIKKQIVAQDPTEKGLRKILNFGHTLGHAVETFYLNKTKQHLLHGEAIAVGMIAEAYMSLGRKLISPETMNQIEEFIFTIYGIVTIPASDFDAIIDLTLQDKKNRGGQVRFSLLTAAGACTYDLMASKQEMKKALAYYAQ